MSATEANIDLAVDVDTEPIERSSEPLVNVNPHLIVVRCSDDEAIAKHGTRSIYTEILFDEQRNGILGRLLGRLQRPGSLVQLVDEGVLTTDEAVLASDAVAYLLDRGVLVPTGQSVARSYARTFIGPDEPLDHAVIGIAGDGALALRLVNALAELEPRAIVTLGHENGKPTTDEPVRAMTGGVHDDTALRTLFAESTFVVVALDRWSPTALHSANAAALDTSTAWMSVMLDGSEAIVGPTFVPAETSCYAEFEFQHESSLTLRDEYLLYKEALIQDPPYARVALTAHVDVAGGLAATAATQFLLRGTTFTINRAVRVNLETASIDYQDVMRLPRCPACQGLRPSYRHTFL